jgi:uncharacterized coiled-coil DUF342 family protein
MTKEVILLKALELAHAEIESLKQQVDDLACDYADVQNDLSETQRELKALNPATTIVQSTLGDIDRLAELKRDLIKSSPTYREHLEDMKQEEIQSKIDDTLELVSTHETL